MATQSKPTGKVDFGHLLRAPAGKSKKPPVLPPADYEGIIKSFELGTSNSEKKTPYVQFNVQLLRWPDTVDEADRNDEDGKPIDLGKRTQRVKYYFGDGQWRLDEFIKSMSEGFEGRAYEEVFPELNGMEVIAEVKQDISGTSGDAFNKVDKLAPNAG